MENPTEEIKTLIHHILHKHKFYRFQMNTYAQILVLLHEQPISNPRLIQQAIFRGIINHNRRFKDNIAASLSDPRFDNIRVEIKQILHRILHQFHFLYSIRAYEMFQPQYVQPGFNSSSTGSGKPPLNDDIERYKLHAMYYGPLSMYHIQQFPLPNANIFPPPLPVVAPQRSMFVDNTQPSIFNNPTDIHSQRSMFDASQRPMFLQTSFKSPLKQSKINLDKQLSVPCAMQIQRHFGGQRGRPSKQRKRMIQKQNNRKLTTEISDILTRRLGNVKFLEERNDDLQFCACQGFISEKCQICGLCNNSFHTLCEGERQNCLACRMKDRDPFNKIDDVLVTSYIYDIENNKFEEQINMKEYYNMCQKTGRFQILVSCVRAGEQDEICWPDDCVFRINGQIVFEIPALLVSHPVRRRKDTAHQITSYVFRQPKNEDHIGLQKTKLSLQWKAINSHPSKRNNRNSIFMLGIYVIKKITPNILFELILQSNKEIPLEKPFQKDIDQPQIDQITVTYFDPFSGALIQTPSRGNLCKHLQCFDLQTFLVFTWASTERAWKCPFCGKDARKLIIDKFQLRILQEINDMDRLPLKVVYYRDEERIQFKGSNIQQQQSQSSASHF